MIDLYRRSVGVPVDSSKGVSVRFSTSRQH